MPGQTPAGGLPRVSQVKADLFRVLGHPARVRILELLRDGERTVGDLQRLFGPDAGLPGGGLEGGGERFSQQVDQMLGRGSRFPGLVQDGSEKPQITLQGNPCECRRVRGSQMIQGDGRDHNINEVIDPCPQLGVG